MDNYSLTLSAAPTDEPLSLNEVKLHLRLTNSDYDDELIPLITEARKYIEEHTGYRLITQTWVLTMDELEECIKLPYPPLQSISSIKYQDINNVQQTLSSNYYTVDNKTIPARVNQAYSYIYPPTYPELNVVAITFICGYGNTAETVPNAFKRAIKMYIQWVFDNDSNAKAILDNFILQNKINWFCGDISD